MSALDQIQSDVAAQSSVIQSAVTLLGSLHTQLNDAIAANNAGDNGAALASLAATLESNTQSLAAAVVANTPAQAGAVGDGGAGTAAAAAPSTNTNVSPDPAVINTSAPVFDTNTGDQVAGPGVSDDATVTKPSA